MSGRGDIDVSLRHAVDGDARIHFSHPASAEIVRMYGGDAGNLPAPNMERSLKWLEWLAAHRFARIVEADGVAVGHVRLHSVSDVDRKARLAIGLFSERYLGRGIGRRAVRLTLDHAFGEMGLHRIDLRVLSFNERAIRCYLACGFVHEGTEREAALVDGAWHDDWIMGMLAREYRRGGPGQSEGGPRPS